MIKNKELSIYVHIPFCISKCAYCDFVSKAAGGEEKETYVKKLIGEIQEAAADYKDYKVKTVFFGGGTPSVLSWQQIKRIWEALQRNYQMEHHLVEATIESNPGTLNKEKLLAYREMGFNRISMGLQSVHDDELKRLGRIHTYQQFLENFKEARNCGFDNINIDLMSALPEQTIETYEESLRTVIALNPEHISAYSLIIEEGTPFYERYANSLENNFPNDLPSEEVEREMYYKTKELLEKHSYHRYEISNYAKKGKECKHNQVYWERGNYLGFGTAAASMIENIRWNNDRKEKQVLSKEEQMEEFIFLGMRKIEGISKEEFQKQFQVSIEDVFKVPLLKLQKEGLVQQTNKRMWLSEYGIDISNYVFSEFLLDR